MRDRGNDRRSAAFPYQPVVGAVRRQAFAATEAIERVVGIDQLFRVLRVHLATLALAIRTELAAHVRAFIPIDSRPPQRIENRLLRGRRTPFLVGVFDAQYELAALAAGERLVDQRDVGRPDVGITSRARCDASTNLHFPIIGR